VSDKREKKKEKFNLATTNERTVKPWVCDAGEKMLFTFGSLFDFRSSLTASLERHGDDCILGKELAFGCLSSY